MKYDVEYIAESILFINHLKYFANTFDGNRKFSGILQILIEKKWVNWVASFWRGLVHLQDTLFHSFGI